MKQPYHSVKYDHRVLGIQRVFLIKGSFLSLPRCHLGNVVVITADFTLDAMALNKLFPL
jgi:hypothetical protein